jgi:hypothetical protein
LRDADVLAAATMPTVGDQAYELGASVYDFRGITAEPGAAQGAGAVHGSPTIRLLSGS